jgi:hypothetical protein
MTIYQLYCENVLKRVALVVAMGIFDRKIRGKEREIQ